MLPHTRNGAERPRKIENLASNLPYRSHIDQQLETTSCELVTPFATSPQLGVGSSWPWAVAGRARRSSAERFRDPPEQRLPDVPRRCGAVRVAAWSGLRWSAGREACMAFRLS